MPVLDSSDEIPANTVAVRRAHLVAVLLGVYTLAGGCVSLLGWALDRPRMADWLMTDVAIQPNAAVATILTGLALLLLTTRYERLAALPGLLVAIIGGTALFENATDIDLGIDRLLLFGRTWGLSRTTGPGRMGIPSSLSYTLIGIALLMSRRGWQNRRDTPMLGLIVCGIAAMGIIGYLYGADQLFSQPRYTAISAQTATFLLAAGMGLVAAVPDRQPMRMLVDDTTAAIFARRTLPFIIMLPVVLGHLQIEGQQAQKYDPQFGTALLVLALVVLLCIVWWWGVNAAAVRERTVSDANRALQNNERRVVGTLDSITDGFVTFDSTWHFTFVNAEAERMLGRRRDELLGCTITELFPEFVQRGVVDHLERAARERTMVEFDDVNPASGRSIASRVYPVDDGGVSMYFRDTTQQRVADARAFRSEQQARTLISVLPGAAVFVVDRELHYTLADGEALHSLGQAPTDFVGRSIHDVLPADKAAEYERRYRQAFDGVPFEHEHDENERTFATRGVPLRDEAGNVYAVMAFSSDITDRKASEVALREAQAQLAEFLRQLPLGVGLLDMQGKYLLSNPFLDRYIGSHLPSRDGSQAPRWRAWTADGSPLPVTEWPGSRALRGDTVRPGVEFLFANDQGEERWTRVGAAPFRNEQGDIVGAVTVIEDIDAQKRAEQKLRETYALIEAVNTGTPDLVFSKDRGGRMTYMNEAKRRLFDQPMDDVLGRTELEILGESAAVRAVHLVDERVMRLGITETVEENSPDGTRVFLITKSPLRDAGGAVIGLAAVGIDTTERKRMEEALREADRRKDEFLATLAHELRNPLAPVMNALAILKHAGHDTALANQVSATMERQLRQMVRLIDDLMDVSRITRNRLELRVSRVELAPIVQHALEACAPLIEQAGHHVDVLLPESPVFLEGDAARLAQVFGNLLVNACKYTEPGGRIQIGASVQDDAVVLVVRDSGVGIPPEMLHTVFEPFTQVDRSLERTHGGLGIGLSLVKQLITLHGGSVTAFSEGAGKGSTFTVRLPLVAARTTVDTTSESSTDTIFPTIRAVEPERRRVLVVDDNEDAAESMALLLRSSGNETTTAHDGVDAVRTAAGYRPHVILMDIGLPGMNGYDACRAIRQEPWAKDILMVALTGWGQEEDRRRSKEAGFDGHLVKPVDYRVVLKLMDEGFTAPV
ncbi:MAG: PAS domain-containing protein [Gemmatimonadota bacterium]